MASVRSEGTGATGTAWEELSGEIRGCIRCPLHLGRIQAVVYRGGAHPWVVFVGEAPGAEEDRVGRPFVGRAGAKLDRAIAGLGLHDSDIGIVNLLKCRPPGNRFDRPAAATCRPYLYRQLDLLRPRLVVTLGRWALHELDPGAPPITRAAGTLRTAGAWTVFPLLHPSAVRSHATARRWDRDLEILAEGLRRSRS